MPHGLQVALESLVTQIGFITCFAGCMKKAPSKALFLVNLLLSYRMSQFGE